MTKKRYVRKDKEGFNSRISQLLAMAKRRRSLWFLGIKVKMIRKRMTLLSLKRGVGSSRLTMNRGLSETMMGKAWKKSKKRTTSF
jgi:hypothetical protein